MGEPELLHSYGGFAATPSKHLCSFISILIILNLLFIQRTEGTHSPRAGTRQTHTGTERHRQSQTTVSEDTKQQPRSRQAAADDARMQIGSVVLSLSESCNKLLIYILII